MPIGAEPEKDPDLTPAADRVVVLMFDDSVKSHFTVVPILQSSPDDAGHGLCLRR